MSYYREQLEEWLKTIDVKAKKVADVGGKELSVKDRVKSWKVRKYIVYDLPDYDLNRSPVYNDCDVVFCLEVFEYVWSPVVAINNLAALTRKGGIIYVSFPFVYCQHNPIEMDYLRYTPRGVEKLCKEAGLTILDHKLRMGNNMLTKFYELDKMKRAKGIDHNVTGSLITAKKM